MHPHLMCDSYREDVAPMYFGILYREIRSNSKWGDVRGATFCRPLHVFLLSLEAHWNDVSLGICIKNGHNTFKIPDDIKFVTMFSELIHNTQQLFDY